jgi:hypothetical protein
MQSKMEFFEEKKYERKRDQNTTRLTKSNWPLFHKINDIIESSPKVTRLSHAIGIGKTSTPHFKSSTLGPAKDLIDLNYFQPLDDNDNDNNSSDEGDEDDGEGKEQESKVSNLVTLAMLFQVLFQQIKKLQI